MADELTEIQKFLVATIRNTVGHERVRFYQAEQNLPRPLVLLRFVPVRDIKGNAQARVMTVNDVDITVVTDDVETAESNAQVSAIDDVLEGVKREHAGIFLLSIRRRRPLAYSSPGAVAGKKFVHRGGTYRVYCGKAV